MRILRSAPSDRGQSVIEQRLERLPRAAIAVFALREALRAAPLISAKRAEDAARLSALSFRALLTAGAAIEDPEARRSARIASDAVFSAACRETVAYPALYAAARVGVAVLAPTAAAAAYAGFAAACSSARAAASRAALLPEAAQELAELEAGRAAETLRAAPLWPFGAPEPFDRAVERLAAACAAPDAPAAGWIGWYRSRLGGWPALNDGERAAALSAWSVPPQG
ncbi:MAG: hypothetical protein AAGM38_17300 [Pseudomonadota bacterium]